MCRITALHLLHGYGEVKGIDVPLKQSPVTIPWFIVTGSFIGAVAVDTSLVEVVGWVSWVNDAWGSREKLRIVSSHVVAIFI